MNLQITGKNMELTPAIKEYVEEKIGKIERFSDHIMTVKVTIELSHAHHDDIYHASALLHVSHDDVHANIDHPDMYAAIDLLKDELERRVYDLKQKYVTKNRRAQKTQRKLKEVTNSAPDEE